MSELQQAGELSTGELLDGRYRLDERIGEGGMARVFRAEDTVLGRTVAVKILRTPIDGQSALERARSETILLASLNHHGLVTLFDANVSEEHASYLVMEYVEGITLRERISQGPVPSTEAASLTIDIAEALHAAHAAGIVHRDVKPSNVLLWRSPLPGREWRAKIADFGIAYLLDSSRITTPGLMVGTVAYIAPEQARGAEPAPAADIYALGLVMIEALTGTRPFAEAEGIGTVMARLQNPPTVPDWVDEGWRHLLSWMTATRPEDRPTALEVAVAASRLAPVAVPSYVDEETAASTPLATGVTAILPVAAGAAAAGMVAGIGSAASGPWSPETATVVAPFDPATESGHVGPAPAGHDRRRRRGFIAAILIGAVILASLIGGGMWAASSLLNAPEPAPSQPVEEQVTDPDVEQTPVVEEPTPVEDPEDNGNSGNGNGNGNGNSGPGNNNGKGKGGGD